MKNKLSLIVVLGSVILLAACEPTNQDINQAMKEEINQMNKSVEKMVGRDTAEKMGLTVNLISTKKIDCKEDSNSSKYNCTVEVEVQSKQLGNKKETGPISMVKDSGKWKLLETK